LFTQGLQHKRTNLFRDFVQPVEEHRDASSAQQSLGVRCANAAREQRDFGQLHAQPVLDRCARGVPVLQSEHDWNGYVSPIADAGLVAVAQSVEQQQNRCGTLPGTGPTKDQQSTGSESAIDPVQSTSVSAPQPTGGDSIQARKRLERYVTVIC
jgi:hypothetical protein